MTISVSDVMRRVRNHFITGSMEGSWQLSGGRLLPAGRFMPGEWIAITGPDAPAGVWQLDEDGSLPDAADAAWTGTICRLSPPEDFLRLCREIAQWAERNPDPALRSERFGAYSRTQHSGDWGQIFASALAPYVRMYPEVNL